MATGYIDPLNAAYRRMKAALFRPFDLGKWFALGFASWIAGWGAGWGGGFNYSSRFAGGEKGNAASTFKEAMGSAFQPLIGWWADPMWRVVVIAGAILVLALGVLILWINSRGEFIFLDAVLHERRAIVEPWRARRTQGNSLFVWRLAFGLIMFSTFAIVASAIVLVASGGRVPRSLGEFPWLMALIGLGMVWVPFAITGVYVDLFLRHFVTPIMFRDRSTTMEAWRTFLPILRERLGAFLIYGLFVLAVHIGLALALIPAICLTCCVLSCVMAIPYIGAVVLLPVSYTFRALGPEFLAQFGPAHSVWPPPPVAPGSPPEVSS